MSSWSSWLPVLIHSLISIISIHFLFKLCTNIRKIAENQTKHITSSNVSDNNQFISNKETLCQRCGANILASSAEVEKNYQNKNHIKTVNDDESYQRCVDNDGENERRLSDYLLDDDHHSNIVGQVSTRREVISYDRQNENAKIVEVSHTKNTVSMLRKQFENVSDKKTIGNLERQISEKFFKRTTSPPRPTVRDNIESVEQSSNNDYYVIEKTKVYKMINGGKDITEQPTPATPSTDKISKFLLSKRSHSNGDINRLKRSPSHDVIAEEPYVLNERTKSVEQVTENFDDVEYRKCSAANNRRSVRTVDDILQQERFSKCYSEYSISDLLNDLPDEDGDSELALFFNKIK